MKTLGAWMIGFGIMALLIGFVGLQFRLLWFLDEFGPVAGFALKIGLILAGIWLWRNGDREPAVEDETGEGRRAWAPVVVSALFVLVAGVVLAVGLLRDARLESLLNRPAPPAAWASSPVSEWPELVLLQKADFKHHTPMEAGCASLVRLPNGDIAALTAGHLLGKDGGVRPGFLRGTFGQLDAGKLATLDKEINSWKLFLPQHEEQGIGVTGLYGDATDLLKDGDEVLLRLAGQSSGYPVKPLDVRLEPVALDEPLRVIVCTLNEDGNFQQKVHLAKRVAGLGFTCRLDQPAELNGCSGAPIVDKDGLLVGIVTGATLADSQEISRGVRSFVGRSIADLTPVMRAALSRRQAAKAPVGS